MTRTYALRKLLEDGAITGREIVVITGWSWVQSRRALRCLALKGWISGDLHIGRTYKLT